MTTPTIISTWNNTVDICSPACNSGPHKSSPSSDSLALNLYNCPLNIILAINQTVIMEQTTASCHKTTIFGKRRFDSLLRKSSIVKGLFNKKWVILGWEALQFSTHDHLSEAKNRPPYGHFEPFGNLHFSIMIYFMSEIDFFRVCHWCS